MKAIEYYESDPWRNPFEITCCRFSNRIRLTDEGRSLITPKLADQSNADSWKDLYQRFGGYGLSKDLKPESSLAAIAYYNTKVIVFEQIISAVIKYGFIPSGDQLDRLRQLAWIVDGPESFLTDIYRGYHFRIPTLIIMRVTEYREGSFNLINVDVNIGSNRLLKFLAAAALATTIVSQADEAYENIQKFVAFVSQEVNQLLLTSNEWVNVNGVSDPVAPGDIFQKISIIFRNEWDWSEILEDDHKRGA